MNNFIYAVGQKRYGVIKTKEGEGGKGTSKPNERHKLNSLTKEYRKVIEEERFGLT